MNCNDAVAALVASLESGEPMTDAQREHIRSCARCRELLDSAKEFQTLLAGNGIATTEVDATVSAAEDELRRKRVRRVASVMVGLASLLLLGVLALLLPIGQSVDFGVGLFFFAVGMLIAIGIALPVVLLLFIVRGASKRRIYKRLRPGKQLSGVALGIAESFGWNVTYVRLAFIALFFLDGAGFWLYLVLDLALPVHPDDRRHLLRFRMQRWWRGLTSRRADHPEGNGR
jgi:phage shock protein PspC (stress-responsive transcriptional regulator)